MLTGALVTKIQLPVQRIFLVPSDIMLLEGVSSDKTARYLYRTILILSNKVKERKEDNSPNQEIKLTVADYARYRGCSIEEILSVLPETPLPYKHFRRS